MYASLLRSKCGSRDCSRCETCRRKRRTPAWKQAIRCARYLRRTHGVRLEDPSLYHLTINTGLLDLIRAEDLIIQAVHGRREE